jgi:hypothetical protein
MDTRWSRWTGTLLLLAGLACSSPRRPSIGVQLVAAGDITDLTFSRPTDEAPTGAAVVYRRASSPTENGSELFSVPASGGTPRLLLTSVTVAGPAGSWGPHGLYYTSGASHAFRIDPVTGISEDLGAARVMLAGDWVLALSRAGAHVWSPGGGESDLAWDLSSSNAWSIGAGLWFLEGSTRRLWRLDESLQPTVVAENVDSFWSPSPTSDAALFVQRQVGMLNDSPIYALSLLDTATQLELPLLTDALAMRTSPTSPDGSTVAVLSRTSTDPFEEQPPLRLVSLANGDTRDVTLPLPAESYLARLFWRPGSQDLWICQSNGTVVIRPDQPPLLLTRTALTTGGDVAFGPEPVIDSLELLQGSMPASAFLAGGQVWLSGLAGEPPHLNDARDPLAPEGDALPFPDAWRLSGIVSTSDGSRLFVRVREGEVGENKRQWYDLYVLDLPGGSPRRLVHDVRAVVHGRDRILALSYPEELALYDVATGVALTVATSVAHFSIAPTCIGCDPVLAGTRIVFAVRGEGEYDGIWIAELP